MSTSFGKFFRKVAVSFSKVSQESSETTQVRMIAGLGNPGDKYAGTRHNIGFEVVDSLARKLGFDVRKKKFGGLFGEGIVEGKKVLLLKPMQFMNRSGQVTATAAGFYRLDKKDVLIITDDMALEPGRIRIRSKGSAGGHNGLGDIIAKLGGEDFARLRVGIGQSNLADAADYVLSRPAGDEREPLDKAIERAAQAAICWLEEGIDAAMNKFNVADSGKE
jgi:PTH1 family peptidyl-tRNA hydrolase